MSNPNQMRLHNNCSLLELLFADGVSDMLSFEMLRVHSPAVTTHYCDHNLPLLVTGKAFVRLDSVEEVENEGLRLIFNDGHDSGVFSWPELYQLAKNQDQLWSNYLKRIATADNLRQQSLNVIVEYDNQGELTPSR